MLGGDADFSCILDLRGQARKRRHKPVIDRGHGSKERNLAPCALWQKRFSKTIPYRRGIEREHELNRRTRQSRRENRIDRPVDMM